MDITLNFGSPVPGPGLCIILIGDVVPVAVANRKKNLFAVNREVAEMRDRSVAPALQLLHRIYLAHPTFAVWHHRAATKEFANLRTAKHPLHHQHLSA